MLAVTISALIYLSAFIYPNYLYVGVFVFIVPLITSNRTYGFKEGYLWGLLFFGGHLAWVALIIYNNGQGQGRMLAYFSLVAYFSLYSGFWLWFHKFILHRYVKKIKNHNRKCAASCCTWVISTVTFICLTCYCSMAMFGCFEGYPFINPLLPLVSWQWYLQPIAYLGTTNYWVFIVLINLSIAGLCRKLDSTPLIFLFMLIAFPTLFRQYNINKIIEKNDFIYVSPTWNNKNMNPSEIFHEIGRQLDQIALKSPDIRFIVMPESGFECNLLHWKNKLHLWTGLFSDTTTIFIGAHQYDQSGIQSFNSLYQICNGSIVNIYNKEHLMILVERIPKLLPMFSGMFITDGCVFSYPLNNQSNMIMAGFQPCICSEIYSGTKRFIKNKPILFVCNDSWFSLGYAKELGKRCVKLYALGYRVPIVYVGTHDYEIF